MRSVPPWSAAISGLLLIGLAAGCAFPGGEGAGGSLVGTSWVVTEIAGTPTLDATRPTMDFGEDGRVAGTDGCNRYSMAFRTDDGSIELRDGQATDIGCEPQVMAQAAAFHQALAGATRWQQRPDGVLELGQGDLVAAPAGDGPADPDDPTAAELAGTSWVLIDLNGSGDFLGSTPTLEIGPEGTLGGFAGCNTYDGSYAVDGTDIAIGPLRSTKMACVGPAGDIETTFLGALDAAGQWSIDDAGHLVLSGPTPLTFAPA